MPFILSGNVGSATAATGYDVANSLRFNDNSSDNLSRTPGSSSAAGRRKFTISAWVKRGNLTAEMGIFSGGADANVSGFYTLMFDDADKLRVQYYEDAFYNIMPNMLFRDPSAWYHIVVGNDTTNNTSANRTKIYVNGVQQAVVNADGNTADQPNSNFDYNVNNDSVQQVGARRNGSAAIANYFDGYIAEFCMIDNQVLAADSFGEFDDSGIWKPIKVSGLTFGTNGFYLEFKGAGTSANSSGLGADTSGNTHHFTVGNLTAVDQSIDTCTNNFCTLNSVDKGFGSTVYTEGNVNATSSSGWNPSRGTIAVTKGKWYWEIVSGNSFQVGVCNDTIDFANNDNAQDLTGVTVFYNASGGIIRTNGSTVGGTTATVDANDTVGFALDMDNKKLSVYKNGSIIVTNTSLSTSITDVAMIFGTTDGGGDFKINFGSPMYAISSGNTDGNGFGNFEYAVPSGYFAICTKNLAENG